MPFYPSMLLLLILASVLGSAILVSVAETQISSTETNPIAEVTQFKPRFDEKIPKTIWIGEALFELGALLNITCIVQADPVAKISWSDYMGAPVKTQPRDPSATVRTVVTDAENMSSLTLHYRNIQNPQFAAQNRFTCTAVNSLGSACKVFEIKLGRIPDSPKITHAEYRDGSIVLTLNQSHLEPPVDIYRLEISDEEKAHLFNMTNTNNTYVIEVNLPLGEHKLNLFAHNPIGWSEEPYASYFLSVGPRVQV